MSGLRRALRIALLTTSAVACGSAPPSLERPDGSAPAAGFDVGTVGPCERWADWSCTPGSDAVSCFAYCNNDPNLCMGCTDDCYKCVAGNPMAACSSGAQKDRSGCERCRASQLARCW